MNKNEVEIVDEPGQSVVGQLGTNEIIDLANNAQQRVDAINKIKQTSIALTNNNDWIDQSGKPYLQGSGCEKLASAFGISWVLDVPQIETEDDGHYMYIYKGTFRMAGREIQVEGSRSSRQKFFTQYKKTEKKGGERIEKPVNERDNRANVRKSAETNCIGKGICRILGIRNMTYPELFEYAGIKQTDLGRVDYNSVKKAKSKSESKKEGSKIDTTKAETGDSELVIIKVADVFAKGKNFFIKTPGDTVYSTFDKRIHDDAMKIKGIDKEASVLFVTARVGSKEYYNICENGFEIID